MTSYAAFVQNTLDFSLANVHLIVVCLGAHQRPRVSAAVCATVTGKQHIVNYGAAAVPLHNSMTTSGSLQSIRTLNKFISLYEYIIVWFEM